MLTYKLMILVGVAYLLAGICTLVLVGFVRDFNESWAASFDKAAQQHDGKMFVMMGMVVAMAFILITMWLVWPVPAHAWYRDRQAQQTRGHERRRWRHS